MRDHSSAPAASDGYTATGLARRHLLRAGLTLPPLFLLAACVPNATGTPTSSAGTAPTAPKPTGAASPVAAAPSPAAAASPVASAAALAAPSPSPSPSIAGSCVLTPKQTEGPYYIDTKLIRSDITEGRPGTPLQLTLTVQDATRCQPMSGATVEIWHADASGVYSGYDSAAPQAQGEPRGSNSGSPAPKPGGPPPGGGPGGGTGRGTPTNPQVFLRGGQISDASGRVTFQTVYPGWYMGRTVHVHVKVYVGGNDVHTGQLYFDDTVTDRVFSQPPYASRPNRDTTNARDSIYRDGGQQTTLALTESGGRYSGTQALTVQV